MKLVLLSGGSGERLWPLSNDARAKQFLKVLKPKDENENEGRSMLQRIWEQLQVAGLTSSTYIVCGEDQEEIIRTQIGSMAKLVLEPEKRDTYPAIVLAASFLHSVEKMPEDELVAVMPVDPYVDDLFFERLKDFNTGWIKCRTKIGLFGVKPEEVSEKYGYIVFDALNDKQSLPAGIKQVLRFVEKPLKEEAARLILEGALWNCGVFVMQLEYILTHIQKKGLPFHYDELKSVYSTLPKISFDYEVIQKEKSIVVCEYEGIWRDLGTWDALVKQLTEPVYGRGFLHEDCVNTHIINELEIPVAAMGLREVVIAASPDGILISDKSRSPSLKELTLPIKRSMVRPMQEERFYGMVRVLDIVRRQDGTESVTKKVIIEQEKNISYHLHNKRREVWTILDGTAILYFEGSRILVSPGEVIMIPIGTKHGILALQRVEMIEVQIGTEIDESDIIRFDFPEE